MESFFSTVGLMAATVSMGVALPQVIRLLRVRHAEGISYLAAILTMLSSGTWLSYGLLSSDTAQIVANAPGLLFAVIIVAVVVRRTAVRAWHAVSASAGWATVSSSAWWWAGTPGIGLAATGVGLVVQAPQVHRVFTGAPLGGLSPWSLLLSQVSATLWVAYGAGTGQLPVVVTAGVGLILASLVMRRRCPAKRVARHLYFGRWGRPGHLVVSPFREHFTSRRLDWTTLRSQQATV